MAAIQSQRTKGRNFTPDELVGRQIRIEGPVPKKNGMPIGHEIWVICGAELVDNACKAVITLEASNITEAKLSLYRFDLPDAPIEEITLRDNIELSFSAIASEVR